MLEVIKYQDVMKEKFRRQNSIKELEYHVHGHCIHLGKISPGCRICFSGEDGGGVQIGQECFFKCPMCYYHRERSDKNVPRSHINRIIADFFQQSLDPEWKPHAYSYQSAGETLLYLDDLEKVSMILQNVEKMRNIHIYHHLYTNGVLVDKYIKRIKNMNVDEIRFHISASIGNDEILNQVLKNMKLAYEEGITVSVEEPSWPPHKDFIFNLLPEMEKIGVSHLNMVEIQLTPYNIKDIEESYPEGKAFKDIFFHLSDEGLVYDIMEEVINKKYSFSVLDCNSGVERFRQFKSSHSTIPSQEKFLDGMCADIKQRRN